MNERTQNYSRDHIFVGTNPSVLVDKTKSTEDGLKTAHTDLGTKEESRSDEILKKIKLEDLSNLMQDTRSAFLTHDSLQDEPIIVLGESEVEETERYEDTHTTFHDGPRDTSIPHPPSPKSVEQQKAKAEAAVPFLKARPSYPDTNQLTKLLITSLKPELSKLLALHDFACCLLTELKELPSKIVELSGDVKELKKNSKGKEVMSSKDVEDEETESDSEDDHANPAKTMTESSKIEESLKAELAKQEVEKVKSELVDHMGIDVVTQYYNKKLMEDGTNEVISNLKVNDLYLAEWRELESLKKVQLQFFRVLERDGTNQGGTLRYQKRKAMVVVVRVVGNDGTRLDIHEGPLGNLIADMQ
ncbi:hypothetical protein Tco_1327823 [Tanacetum coccineum]